MIRKNKLGFIVYVAIMGMAIMSIVKTIQDDRLTYEETAMLTIQVWRSENNLPEYKIDSELCELAERRSFEISDNWSHDGFVGLIFSTEFRSLGENISREFEDPRELVQGWLDSPTHRENLDADFEYSCLRCNELYCAHIFGK